MAKVVPSLLGVFRPERRSIGIEMTDYAIKLCELALHKNGTLITNVLTVPLPKNAIDDGRIKNKAAVTSIMTRLLQQIQYNRAPVHIILPSQLVMVRFLKFPDLQGNELRKVIDFELKHNIHLPFEQPLYDFVKLNGANEDELQKRRKQRKKAAQEISSAMQEVAAAGESNTLDQLFNDINNEGEEAKKDQAPECDVMLVAAPQELVHEYQDFLLGCGIKPKSMEIKALSLFRFIHWAKLAGQEETYLVVDINENYSDLSIFHHEQLKITRSVPLDFSKDKVQPSHSQEVELFQEFMDTDSDFKNVCGDLAHELERLMNFYRYSLNNRTEEFNKLIVTGDVERISEIAELLRERLTLNVESLQSDCFVSAPDQILSDQQLAAYAVPIGLALRGKEA